MINIIMLFWDMGCEFRNKNTRVSWNELKKMTEYLKNKNLNVNCHLFEFGEKFAFEDSIKIKMNLNYYERSKKINISLNHEINNECEFVSIMDSDTFFIESDYDILYKDFVEITNSQFPSVFTYNLLDVDEISRDKIIDNDKNLINFDLFNSLKNTFGWRHSFGAGTMGGFFICPTKNLKDINGFDENYLTWGAEDDNALTRLKGTCVWSPRLWTGPAHLYHPKNEEDKKYYIPVYTDEYFKINKVTR